MGYISEHMNPKNKLAPLFEAQLELLDPDMVFSPTLDSNDEKGFTALINNLIDDILRMSTLIERIDKKKTASYHDQIIKHNDIIEMKEEVFDGIERVINILLLTILRVSKLIKIRPAIFAEVSYAITIILS